jgi:hypothetical protein
MRKLVLGAGAMAILMWQLMAASSAHAAGSCSLNPVNTGNSCSLGACGTLDFSPYFFLSYEGPSGSVVNAGLANGSLSIVCDGITVLSCTPSLSEGALSVDVMIPSGFGCTATAQFPLGDKFHSCSCEYFGPAVLNNPPTPQSTCGCF